MKKLFTFVCLWAVSCVAFSAMAQELNGKTYTIHNNVSTDAYMQDNARTDNIIDCGYLSAGNSIWEFTATGNENCYYIKNTVTGKYIQSNSTTSEQAVTVGDTPAEYYVAYVQSNPDNSSEYAWGFSATANTPHDFTDGTMGLNLHAEPSENDCYVQSYDAVSPSNRRSFWVLEEQDLGNANAGYVGSAPANGEDFFLYNIGTGKWLADNDWNTTSQYWTSYAQLGSRGRDFEFISENGGWRINPKMGGNHCVRCDLWMDTSDTDGYDWTLTLVDGTTDHYTITGTYSPWGGSANYQLGADVNGYLTNSNPTYGEWKLVTRADRLAYEQTLATSDAPVDMSWIVLGGSFPVADEHITDGTWDFMSTEDYFDSSMWNIGGDAEYNCSRVFETWNIYDREMWQDIPNIPNGTYSVYANAIYVSTADADVSSAHYDAYINGSEPTKGSIFANDETTPMINMYSLVTDSYTNVRNTKDLGNGKWAYNGTNEYSTNMFEGKGEIEHLIVTVDDGHMRVGAKVEDGEGTAWIILDNFRVFYYGNSLTSEDYHTDLTEAIAKGNECLASTPATDAWTSSLTQAITTAEGLTSSDDLDAISQALDGIHTAVWNIELNAANAADLRFAVEYEAEQGSTDELMTSAMTTVNDVLANGTTHAVISAGVTTYKLARRLVHGGHHDYSSITSTAPSDGLEAYLYNVGTGLYLCGGNSWGTHASVGYTARTTVLKSNSYTTNCFDIRTNLPNGVRGTNDWLGHNAYVDCGNHTDNIIDWGWQFEAVGDGSYRLVNLQGNGEYKYLGLVPNYHLQLSTEASGADDPNNHWKLITKAQLDELFKSATSDNPVDASYYIHQPTFSSNDFDGDDKEKATAECEDMAWVRNAGAIWGWKGATEWLSDGDFVYEIWDTGKQTNGPVYIYQDITGLTPGVYEVSVTGYYRDGEFAHAATVADNPEKWAYLFANNDAELLPAITDYADMLPNHGRTADNGLTFPDDCTTAAQYFEMGLYTATAKTTVGSDGKLRIAVSKERTTDVTGDDWVVVDNFRLTYLGANGEFTITDAGYATYYTEDEYIMPKGVVGTTITGIENELADDGGYILDAEWSYVEGTTVPSKTALVLQGEAGTYEYTITNTNATAPTDNMLNGSTVDKTLTYGPDSSTDYYFYELTYGTEELSDVIGFFWANEDGSAFESEAHKAWLSVPQTMAMSIKHFSLSKKDEETTGITTVEATSEDDTIYNLQGVRVNDMSRKGVYIVGGKKVIVK